MKGRCLHRKRGVCPSCRRFEASLAAAIKAGAVAWTPGILGRLNKALRGRR